VLLYPAFAWTYKMAQMGSKTIHGGRTSESRSSHSLDDNESQFLKFLAKGETRWNPSSHGSDRGRMRQIAKSREDDGRWCPRRSVQTDDGA
jgi:hypothetical protein